MNSATSDNQTNGNQITQIYTSGSAVDVQNPFPTDGDSVYAKDVDVSNSSIGDFSGSITDLFDDIDSMITTSVDNPTLTISLKRPVDNHSIIISTKTGNFSNVTIVSKDSSGATLETIDDSANDTKYTTNEYFFQTTDKWCTLVITFATTDDVTLGYICVPKGIHVDAHLHALKPDGTVTAIDATAGGNLKVSLEEFDESLTTGGALNIHDADIHTKIINRHFIDFDSATENPSVAIEINDTVILVASTTGFTVGDNMVIKDAGGDVREHVFIIVAVVADTSITVNRKIDVAYTTSATLEIVLTNMAVSGSLASPKTYVVEPPSDEVWHITRVLISIVDGTAMDDGKFGGISALTNGVILEEEKTPNYTITGWRSNADMKADMYDVAYSTRTVPAGSYGLTGRFTFEKSGAIVRLDGALGDKLEVYIQDDLTDLITFDMKAQGHVEE